MKLTDQVTSLELSKRLEKLGVKQDGYYIWKIEKEKYDGETTAYVSPKDGWKLDALYGWIPAYTVAELWDILPSRLFNPAGGEHSTHQLVCEKFPDGRANASYVCIKCKGNLVQIQESESLAEELGKLLEYLIKNNLMSV